MVQLHLLLLYRKNKPLKNTDKTVQLERLPFITIQLPIFNELYVVERLIDKILAINYPKDKLEIQILDDSNDETVSIIKEKVDFYKKEGFDINHIRRPTREGFKAGALAYGLRRSKGELIAIFDADFLPESDFLKRVIPYFSNDKIGMVQTRWGYLNKDYSLFTNLQAFGLNAHFLIEQTSRNYADYFINFNGTAGVWRKTCIEDGGGWNDDTLTEDLDLSYRCQFNGWKMKYLVDVVSPAELPVSITAIKTQQYRWNKGAAETVRKHFKNILFLSVPLPKKIHAIFHLMNSTIFISILVCGLLSIPTLFIKYYFEGFDFYFDIVTVTFSSFIILSLFYWNAQIVSKVSFFKRLLKFIYEFIMFLAISMGLSLHNGIGVLEGYLGRKTPFIRTPKFNIIKKKESWKSNKYLISKLEKITYLEGLLALYFSSGLYFGIVFQNYGLFFFHFVLSLGFSIIFFTTIIQSIK